MTLVCDRTEIFAGASFGMAQNKPTRAKAVSTTSTVLFIGGSLEAGFWCGPKYMPGSMICKLWRSVEKGYFLGALANRRAGIHAPPLFAGKGIRRRGQLAHPVTPVAIG